MESQSKTQTQTKSQTLDTSYGSKVYKKLERKFNNLVKFLPYIQGSSINFDNALNLITPGPLYLDPSIITCNSTSSHGSNAEPGRPKYIDNQSIKFSRALNLYRKLLAFSKSFPEYAAVLIFEFLDCGETIKANWNEKYQEDLFGIKPSEASKIPPLGFDYLVGLVFTPEPQKTAFIRATYYGKSIACIKGAYLRNEAIKYFLNYKLSNNNLQSNPDISFSVFRDLIQEQYKLTVSQISKYTKLKLSNYHSNHRARSKRKNQSKSQTQTKGI